MTKNPVVNAALAALYIAGIVTVISSLGNFENSADPGLLAPLLFISLLVLSVLVMSYLFFLQPMQMYLDGQKKEAITLFGHTVLAFAALVVVLLGTLFFSMR